MPIPEPKATENQKEFMQRCVSVTIKEYDKEQAIAICYNKWINK
jgi:hypothetical protein